MALHPVTIVVAFAVGAAVTAGASLLQREVGIGMPAAVAQPAAKPAKSATKSSVVMMDDERTIQMHRFCALVARIVSIRCFNSTIAGLRLPAN